MGLSKRWKYILKSFIVSIECFLNLKLVGLPISLFNQLIQLFRVSCYNLYLWIQIYYIFLSKSRRAFSTKIVSLLEYNSQAKAKIPKNGDFTELKSKKRMFVWKCMFELFQSNFFEFLPKVFFGDSTIFLFWFCKGDFKVGFIILIFPFFIFFTGDIEIGFVISFDVFMVVVFILLISEETIE